MVITFYKHDKHGIHQYYTIHDRQGDFFSKYTFTSIWGKSPNNGRSKSYIFENQNDMDHKLREILKRKVRQGYKVLYKFSRQKHYSTIFDSIAAIKVS